MFANNLGEISHSIKAGNESLMVGVSITISVIWVVNVPFLSPPLEPESLTTIFRQLRITSLW